MLYRHEITPEEVLQIKAAVKSGNDEHINRRLTVLLLRAQGVELKEIAKRTGFDDTWASKLIAKYKKHGLEALTRSVPRYYVGSWETAGIKAAMKIAGGKRAAVRLRALLLRAEGLKIKDIAARTGIGMSQVMKFIVTYKKHGLDAVIGLGFRGYRFSPEEVMQIKAAKRQNHNKIIDKRLTALLLRAEGTSRREIVARTGLSEATVSVQIAKYKKHGIEAVTGYHGHTPAYSLSGKEIRAIEDAIKHTKSKPADRRLRVLLFRAEGLSNRETARRVGCSETHASQIALKYKNFGLEAILRDGRPGRYDGRNMRPEDERAFIAAFKEKSAAGQVFRVKDVREAYDRKIGHKTSDKTVYAVFRRQNWHPKQATFIDGSLRETPPPS
jgi:transposase